VLYIPNERPHFSQVSYRRTLTNLRDSRLIADLSVFSLQLRILNGGEPEEEIEALIRRVADFKPNVVLIQKPALTSLRAGHLSRLRACAEFKLIYHEGDPYAWPLHSLPRASRHVARFADVIYTMGSGEFANNFKRLGARDVRYLPWGFAPDYVGEFTPATLQMKTHDVVVIANRLTPRFRGLPNWRDRIHFVELLQSRFGDRLGLYGKNWSGPGALGPADFYSQSEIVKTGWITANWDHFAKEPKYFSDRLPIALAAGSVHATTYHPGYEDIFPEQTRDFLIWGKSPEALVDLISQKIENTTKSDFLALAQQANLFAESNFRIDRQAVSMINFDGIHINPIAADSAWDISVAPVSEI